MTEMNAATAAAQLGVTERQVARLASQNVLKISRIVGRTLLLDAASVHQLAGRVRHNGRPWQPATAWAALALLSGAHVDWLDPSTLSRLRHRLRGAHATDVAWLARQRATVHQMQGWGNDTGLIPTGVSALRDPAVSALFGLTPTDRGTDGYVLAGDFDALTTNLGLRDDLEGEMVVRVIPDDAGRTPHRPLIATIAVDLSESLDTRESAAGLRVLEKLLAQFRDGDGQLNRNRPR